MITDRTGEDDDTFAATLARVEAADEAPESVRERMTTALFATEATPSWRSRRLYAAPIGGTYGLSKADARRLADAAIAVLRGEP